MKKKKVMALLLAAAMLLGGCGAKEAGETGKEPETADKAAGETKTQEEESGEMESAEELDYSEQLTYTIFIQADDVPDPEGLYESSPVINYWQDMFNVDLEWQLPPQGSESDQFTLMIGTGDYTDIMDMSFNTENLATLCEDEVIYDLTPYVEKYMPNYTAYMDANPDVKSTLYNDEGHIYLIGRIEDNPKQWGGLVYRRDILETMTGGSVAFPSGNEEPATVEDWEYMLDLMNQYFGASGMAEYAGLILPVCGYFSTGELMAGFGIGGLDYIDENGNAAFGIASDNFYNYLEKMHEWYEKGYIYADFASRSQDMFYLPNTALTYGGAAGIWYGLVQQLGDTMSLPDYGLYMDVKPICAPADMANGVEKPLGVFLDAGRVSINSGYSISTACSEEKLIRILSAFDYFYSDEGAATRTMGLSAEQGAADWPDYTEKGAPNGARKNGSIEWTEEMDSNAELGQYEFASNRMPGIIADCATRTCELAQDGTDLIAYGDKVWTQNGNGNVYPLSTSFLPEETSAINTLQTNMLDYADTAIVSFILGEKELTKDSFAEYQQQLEKLGLSEYLSIRQTAYERYRKRAD